MNVHAIRDHFLSRASWLQRETTVDRVIAGNPEADVDRCLVTWMPSMAALKAAVERDIELIICHEPTFWNHHDECPDDDPQLQAKRQFIDDHHLTILRNHDAWDRWPEHGIPWAWARFLELGDRPVATGAQGYQHRYDIETASLDTVARRIAGRCATLGEPWVQVTGDLAQPVSRIGIGTGCCCNIAEARAMDCDVSIVCDDGSCYWAGIQRAEDTGHPVIRVNHGTSEEPGMISLAAYINETIDGLTADHLPHGSTFQLVGAHARSR